MPTTISNLAAMFPASHLVQEFAAERAGGAEWVRRGWKFGSGRYVGPDGKRHVGIERRPFVMPFEKE